MSTDHNCRLTGMHNELLYICSRCSGCYVCEHQAVLHGLEKKWFWICRDGKLRPCINDGRLQEFLGVLPESLAKGNGCEITGTPRKNNA